MAIIVAFFSVPSTEFGNCSTGEVRLVNGTNILEGRVEICINNAWGTVCHNKFSSSDADVVCRSLGVNFADSHQLPLSEYGPGTGPIFLDDLSCEEEDETLLDCSSAPLSINTCTHDHDVAVRCDGM